MVENEAHNKIDGFELEYAEKTRKAIKECMQAEIAASGKRKSQILEQRRYFSDYFAELKNDEKLDLLSNEALDTRDYLGSVTHLRKLARQEQEPYFAGFDFVDGADGEDGGKNRLYVSLQTLRDPETDEIITFDWRAPICSLYYESEPGPAYYDTPGGRVNVDLTEKRRYRFVKGKLVRVSRISMPSDDEILSEALGRHAGDHMRIIVESLQKEQHRIVRDHIEGVTVISGCAGSGKTSVALHKAAYILYGFRDRMNDRGIAIISPNDIFSEYISTVLPNLGEDNIKPYLQEDLVNEVLADAGALTYMTRLDEAELSGEFGLESENGSAEESEAMTICRRLKSSSVFRDIILKYADYLRRTIFVPEEMSLTEDNEGKVSAETLGKLFYNVYSDAPVFKRTQLIRNELCRRFNIRKEINREYILNTLDSMLTGVNAQDLYRGMYADERFLAELGTDITPLTFFSDMFEDACAVAVLHLILNEPELGGIFYLICDEAQDLSDIFLEVLRRRFPGANMLFVGDSDQAVFGNSGDFVERIRSVITKRPFKRYVLETNYRSTSQIVDYSSAVLGKEPGSIRSVRSGEEPVFSAIPSGTPEEETGRLLSALCLRAKEDGFESFAFITKTRAQAERLKRICSVPSADRSDFRTYFVPVYLAKGLEFDAVAVYGVNDPYYTGEEGRLALYTACTRALHRLVLIET